jgi:hypothetical protein
MDACGYLSTSTHLDDIIADLLAQPRIPRIEPSPEGSLSGSQVREIERVPRDGGSG